MRSPLNIVHQSYNHPRADIVANRMMLATLRASAAPYSVRIAELSADVLQSVLRTGST
jgi:hypothetical protein